MATTGTKSDTGFQHIGLERRDHVASSCPLSRRTGALTENPILTPSRYSADSDFVALIDNASRKPSES